MSGSGSGLEGKAFGTLVAFGRALGVAVLSWGLAACASTSSGPSQAGSSASSGAPASRAPTATPSPAPTATPSPASPQTSPVPSATPSLPPVTSIEAAARPGSATSANPTGYRSLAARRGQLGSATGSGGWTARPASRSVRSPSRVGSAWGWTSGSGRCGCLVRGAYADPDRPEERADPGLDPAGRRGSP